MIDINNNYFQNENNEEEEGEDEENQINKEKVLDISNMYLLFF